MMHTERIRTIQDAMQEAGRCLLCHDSPCDTGCGAAANPATFLYRLRLGDMQGAVRALYHGLDDPGLLPLVQDLTLHGNGVTGGRRDVIHAKVRGDRPLARLENAS